MTIDDRRMPDGANTLHRTMRIRHSTRRRLLTVSDIDRLTPEMLRITFSSPELADFESPAHDDHVKLFFTGPDGAACMRDYTPRRVDRRRQTPGDRLRLA